jgi:hypothetical protein
VAICKERGKWPFTQRDRQIIGNQNHQRAGQVAHPHPHPCPRRPWPGICLDIPGRMQSLWLWPLTISNYDLFEILCLYRCRRAGIFGHRWAIRPRRGRDLTRIREGTFLAGSRHESAAICGCRGNDLGNLPGHCRHGFFFTPRNRSPTRQGHQEEVRRNHKCLTDTASLKTQQSARNPQTAAKGLILIEYNIHCVSLYISTSDTLLLAFQNISQKRLFCII